MILNLTKKNKTPNIIEIIEASNKMRSLFLSKHKLNYNWYESLIPQELFAKHPSKKNSFIIRHFERTLFYGK